MASMVVRAAEPARGRHLMAENDHVPGMPLADPARTAGRRLTGGGVNRENLP